MRIKVVARGHNLFAALWIFTRDRGVKSGQPRKDLRMRAEMAQTPLAEFCRLVRRGVIPGEEVKRLIDKHSSNGFKMQETLDQLLEKLREDARQIDDVSVNASAWALIATISHSELDIEEARSVILNSDDSDDTKAANLMAIVKTLAEAGRIAEARSLAFKIDDLSSAWCAEAFLHLARFSRDKSDLEHAHSIIEDRVRNPLRQEELLADFEQIEREISLDEFAMGMTHLQKKEALEELVYALSELDGYRNISRAASCITSASIRFRVRASIAGVLASAIK